MDKMDLNKLTYTINGCAMKVHNTLGNGFQEVIYQRCLAIEMERAGLGFARELDHTIYYEGIEVGTRRADFVIEDNVIVELKALINLEDVHLAQAKNYVVAYDKPVGLLINFGARSLQFKKIYNPKFNTPKTSESGLSRFDDEQDSYSKTKSSKSTNPNNQDSDK